MRTDGEIVWQDNTFSIYKTQRKTLGPYAASDATRSTISRLSIGISLLLHVNLFYAYGCGLCLHMNSCKGSAQSFDTDACLDIIGPPLHERFLFPI